MTRREFSRLALAAAATVPFVRLVRAQIPSMKPTAADTHAHIFERRLKLAPMHRYAPAYDATLGDYLRQLDAHGMAQGVLVQPSFLGTDNGYLVAALQSQPERLRGIAVVEPAAPTRALATLDAAGVVGIRLNLIGVDIPAFTSPAWADLLRRVADLDWQVEVHREAGDLPRVVDPLLKAGSKVVVDHFGRPDPKLGVDDPGFRYLLGAAATRRVWIKLSGAYRLGGVARGEAIAREAVPLLRRAFGRERLLWGSDWPHTQCEQIASYDGAMAAFRGWIPDAGERAVILGDTARRLFRFS